MTIEEFKEGMSHGERRAFAAKLQCWLGCYTQPVYVSVMKKMEEIINNPTALRLIDELYERTQKETADEISQIYYSLGHESDLAFELHNHCLTHSGSYRDILYDMYIKD